MKRDFMKKFHEHEEESMIPSMSKYAESYVKLTQERVIFLSEDFTKETSSAVSALLLHYDNLDQDEDITIYINSNGGDASAFTCIYDVMQMITAPVKTVCIGKAYSAGAYLLCAGTKGKRYIMPNAEVMIHRVQCGFPMINKTQVDHESYLSFLNLINDNIIKILAKHTGKTLKEIKEDFDKTRHIFLDPKQAVKYGIVDHIL